MASPRKRIRRKTLRLMHLNPSALLDLGYTFHAASDESLKARDNAEYRLAVKAADDFLALTADPLSPEGIYLLRVRPTVLSLARAITRRKNDWLRETRAAQEEFAESRERLKESRINSIFVKMVWRLVATGLVASIGFLLAWIAAPLIPAEVGESTGKGMPSIVVGLCAAAATWYISFLLDDLNRGRMLNSLRWRENMSRQQYEEGKIEEQRHHWTELVNAWRSYTGKTFAEKPPYERIMLSDLRTSQELSEILNEHSRSLLVHLVRGCYRGLRRKLKRQRPD